MKDQKSDERTQRFALTMLVSAVVLVFFVLTGVVILAILLLLIRLDVLHLSDNVWRANLIVSVTVLGSVLVGMLITMASSRIPLKPVNKIINAMQRLASGDFRTRLSFRGPVSRHSAVREFTDSFNAMAAELESTEVLRSDFINNFSHEFKTPIVSIAGFAKLLRRGELSEEEREEYLEIIERESLRLSAMATNALNLSKIESQTILTGVTRYNLSEQLRSCVLLLEARWAKKSLDWDMDFDEYTVCGSESLLREVWVNLLDNAIKFADEGSTVRVGIAAEDAVLRVSIADHGPDIPEESLPRVFHKFYQADPSRATEGNGIGLAVVQRVVQLHGGTVAVRSGGGETVFTVTLPREGAGATA